MNAPGLEALRGAAGPVALVGLGNPGRGDDGFGVRLAEAMAGAGHPHAVVAGTTLEAHVEALASGGYAHVVFLDAAEFAGGPGEAVFLDAEGIAARYPQVSTHRIALGTLARVIGARGPRVWLLGVRPASLAPGDGLSGPVRRAVDLLRDVLVDVLGVPEGGAAGSTGRDP